jgi:aminoglycoside phosphotransferase (APT) family kinase protein
MPADPAPTDTGAPQRPRRGAVPTEPSADVLTAALKRALHAAHHPLATEPLLPLPDRGLAHAHVRLGDSGWLARVPKQSQLGLAAAENLAYQRACFARAAASGHTPALQVWLAPSPDLPRGALIVACIHGRPPRLPNDLPALMQALAALHALPLPAPHVRPPLRDPADPLAELAGEIDAHLQHAEAAALAPATRAAIDDERARLAATRARADRPPRTLVAFDAHPGNFLVQPDGRAVLVDLEKCRYGLPSLDLAHATLYTSTTWDVASHAVLDAPAVADALHHWSRSVGAPLAKASAAWHLPLRRGMWLWSLSWCAKWRAASRARPDRAVRGEDWSAEHSDPALVAHVQERVDHYLHPVTVEQVRAGFERLGALLA